MSHTVDLLFHVALIVVGLVVMFVLPSVIAAVVGFLLIVYSFGNFLFHYGLQKHV